MYQYKDHLGNVRLSYADTNNDGTITAATEIIEEKNYYPFGMLQKGYNNVVTSNGNSLAQKFGFIGMELNDELGLNWYDIKARNYDPALGRWMNLDPLADHDRQINRSPYQYGWNNPIYYNDPDGNCPQCLSGAVISAFLEAVNQVGSSMLIDGLDFDESIEALDYGDILIEAGTGALSGLVDGGASKLAKFLSKKKNRELFARVLGVVLDRIIDVVNTVARNFKDGEEDLITIEEIVEILVDAGFEKLVEDMFPDIDVSADKKEIKKQKKKEKSAKSKKKKKEAKKKKKEAKKRKKKKEKKNKRNQVIRDGVDFLYGIDIDWNKVNTEEKKEN